MSGTYLVCDLCGKFGPPVGFLFKDGIRMCYECFYQNEVETKEPQEHPEKSIEEKPEEH